MVKKHRRRAVWLCLLLSLLLILPATAFLSPNAARGQEEGASNTMTTATGTFEAWTVGDTDYEVWADGTITLTFPAEGGLVSGEFALTIYCRGKEGTATCECQGTLTGVFRARDPENSNIWYYDFPFLETYHSKTCTSRHPWEDYPPETVSSDSDRAWDARFIEPTTIEGTLQPQGFFGRYCYAKGSQHVKFTAKPSPPLTIPLKASFTYSHGAPGGAQIDIDGYIFNVPEDPSLVAHYPEGLPIKSSIDMLLPSFVAFDPSRSITSTDTRDWTSVHWDFGDGKTHDPHWLHLVGHQYDEPGVYNVTLTLTWRGFTHSMTQTIRVNHELVSTPPEVTITEPKDGQIFHSPPGEKLSIILRGTVTDKEGDVKSLFISALCGKSVIGRGDVMPDASGAFSCLIKLLPGDNTISVKARDAGGNETERSLIVTLVEGTPPIVEPPEIVTEEEEAPLRASEEAKEVEEKISENKPTYDELKTEAPEGGTVDKVTLIPPEGTEEELADIHHTPKKKKAYILTSPELGTWHRIISWPKKKAIMNRFKYEGYEVIVLEATEDNIRKVAGDPDTEALGYFGHNRFPTLEGYDADALQSMTYREKYKRYSEEMTEEEAKEKAKGEPFELKYFYNHSCYSLGEEDKTDTSLFDGTLRPGGIGWGHQGSLHMYHPLTKYTRP